MDTLFSVDLARLTQGEEVVHPRAIVSARLKFINEVQRANSLVYNALLPLFSERAVVFRDRVFRSPAFVAYLDANPHDAGSSEMPSAFLDRIDLSVRVPLASVEGLARILATATQDGPARWNEIAELARPALAGAELERLWEEVRRISIGEEVRQIASLVAAHLQRCARADRSIVGPDFDLRCEDCSFRSNACAKLTTVPGNRFVLSSLKLAQARAWLRELPTVEIEDLIYALPYTLAHRLRLRTDAARLYPGLVEWIVEELYRSGLRQRIPRWRQALDLLGSEAPEAGALLADLARRDLAIDHLLSNRDGGSPPARPT